MTRFKGMMLGALAGSMLASAFAFFGTRQAVLKKLREQTQEWATKAKNVRENIFENDITEARSNYLRRAFARGAFIGLLLGAGSAVLLTPKTGKQLRKDLTQKYQGVADKTQDIVEYINQNGYRKPLKKLSKTFSKKRTISRPRAQ